MNAKSSIQLANTIAWLGVLLATLILIYGPHGPARHPKMLLICMVPIAIASIGGMRSKGTKLTTILACSICCVIGAVTSFLLSNTELGKGIHPLTTPAVLLVLGVVTAAIVSQSQFDESSRS